MKIIAKERGMGKTEYLIKRSLETGYPIICTSEATKRLIQQRNNGVYVITVSEIRSRGIVPDFRYVLVDELEYVLNQLLGFTVAEATFTGDINVETIENIPVKTTSNFKMKV